jgi:diguanylate cyclase (GGDEF)-like protein
MGAVSVLSVKSIPKLPALGVSAALVLGLGYLEANTPTELSFGGLYFVPVAIAAWAGGLRWGVVAAFGTAIDWVVANITNAQSFERLGLRLWTGGNHFVAYSFLAWLVDRAHRLSHELSEANASLQDQSLTDPLTGLRNRRYLDVCMPTDAAASVRTHWARPVADPERPAPNVDLIFLLLDLDHFKAVNDRHGHHAGDIVLREMAKVLRSLTREADTVIRWGGEEFLIVARHSDRREAALLAERLRFGVESHAFPITAGAPTRLTCSVGFSFYPFLVDRPDAYGWDDVLTLVDHCLYMAKQGGRNAWVGLGAGESFPAEAPQNLVANAERFVKEGHLLLQSSLDVAPCASPKSHPSP